MSDAPIIINDENLGHGSRLPGPLRSLRAAAQHNIVVLPQSEEREAPLVAPFIERRTIPPWCDHSKRRAQRMTREHAECLRVHLLAV